MYWLPVAMATDVLVVNNADDSSNKIPSKHINMYSVFRQQPMSTVWPVNGFHWSLGQQNLKINMYATTSIICTLLPFYTRRTVNLSMS